MNLTLFRKPFHLRLETAGNPVVRINVGNESFCKPWICCCAYGQVWFMHKKTLLGLGKDCFWLTRLAQLSQTPVPPPPDIELTPNTFDVNVI